MALQPFVELWPFFQFRNPLQNQYKFFDGDQPVVRPLPTQTQNKCTQSSMIRVGFELIIPVFERREDGSCLRPRGHCNRFSKEPAASIFRV
jgi:hypothetical protein